VAAADFCLAQSHVCLASHRGNLGRAIRHANLGQCHESLGEVSEALNHFQLPTSNAPSSPIDK